MVAMILGTGFEPLEAVAPCDILRRGGVEVKLAAIGDPLVGAGHGVRVQADCTLAELDAANLEMVILPGGLGGVQAIGASAAALALVREVYHAGGYVAAICAGPTVLAKLGLLEGKQATCYPGCEGQMAGALMQNAAVVRDGRIITGRAAGAAADFGLALLAALKGEQEAKRVADEIVYVR